VWLHISGKHVPHIFRVEEGNEEYEEEEEEDSVLVPNIATYCTYQTARFYF
jgi:hypothetical protein